MRLERRTHYASETFLINFNRMQFCEKSEDLRGATRAALVALAPIPGKIYARRRNYSPRSFNRVCLALSSLGALGELRCQETTRHRSVSSCPNNVNLLFPASFHHLRFGFDKEFCFSGLLMHSSPSRPQTPSSSKFMPSKHFIRIKNDSLEFHFALFFIFFAVVVSKLFLRSHFTFEKAEPKKKLLTRKTASKQADY